MKAINNLPEDLIQAAAEIIGEGCHSDEVKEGEDEETPKHEESCKCESCLAIEEQRQLSEAEEIPLFQLSSKTKAFLKKLPPHEIETAWSGIHGVIVALKMKTFSGQAARLDVKTLKAISSDSLVRWMEGRGSELFFGLDYAAVNESVNKEEDMSKTVKENVAISPAELASSEPNSAIGHREPGSELPKHVDVVRETDMRPTGPDGVKKEGFRLLLQYSTNRRVEFVPSLDLPAAPDIDSLVALVPGSPEVVAAVMAALDLPHNRPQYAGQEDKES